MKPETFEGSIQKGTNQLYVTGERRVVAKNGAFVKLGNNSIFYRAENIEQINLRKKFISAGKELIVKGNLSYKIAPSDTLQITFDEFEAVKVSNVQEHENEYQFNEKIYAQGGVTSNSNTNLTGAYAEITITKIDDKGKILEVQLSSPGKYIIPPSNPVPAMDERGEVVNVDLEFEEASTLSILERQVTYVEPKDGNTHVGISYPLPQGVEEGEFTLSKQIIILDKPYAQDSLDAELCHMTFDFSPVNGIPLLPPNSIDPHATYNEAIKIIEDKFSKLEERMLNLENRKY